METTYVHNQAAREVCFETWSFDSGKPLFIKNEDPAAPSAIRFRFLALGPEGIKLADSFDGFVDILAYETDDTFVI